MLSFIKIFKCIPQSKKNLMSTYIIIKFDAWNFNIWTDYINKIEQRNVFKRVVCYLNVSNSILSKSKSLLWCLLNLLKNSNFKLLKIFKATMIFFYTKWPLLVSYFWNCRVSLYEYRWSTTRNQYFLISMRSVIWWYLRLFRKIAIFILLFENFIYRNYYSINF